MAAASCGSSAPPPDAKSEAALEETADRMAAMNDMQAVDGALGITGDATGITAAKYAQLDTGMSYSDAAKVLGTDGEEVSRSSVPGVATTVMYAWKNPDGSNMTAMFQNGGLVMKSQYGLH